MKNFIFIIAAFFLPLCSSVYSLSISSENAQAIATKIWKNECGGSLEGLTWWNKGENFGSFGIGHFIWYPNGQEKKFQETFPDLIKYLQREGVVLPAWLNENQKCPWNTRDEFYKNFLHPQMIELRQMLFETKSHQAAFLANRLEQTSAQLFQNLSIEEKEHIQTIFYRLAHDSRGLYALIDYLNFKGSGTLPDETYKGQGWGLLQVLQQISPLSKDVVGDFVMAAKKLLMQRVQNAPPERDENRWLQGWINRVNTYL